ncbi:MAG TPA: hypothetical protein VET85_15640 [Stellaceae bacterium]|nr:hypothetical protein [Stellaceae bacterium]
MNFTRLRRTFVLRAIALVLTVLTMASCHPAFVPPFTSETPFDQSDKWGLVVTGLSCNCPTDADIFFVHWFAYDAGKQSVLAPLDSSEPVGWTPGFALAGGLPRDMRYSIMRLPPGDYILGAATIVKNGQGLLGDKQRSFETRFIGSEESLKSLVPMIWSAEARSTANSPAPRVTVKAGEILYIGNYSFDVDGKYRSSLPKSSSDMTTAGAKLKKFPNVHGDMRMAEIRTK